MALARRPSTTVKLFLAIICFSVITYMIIPFYMRRFDESQEEMTFVRDVVLNKSKNAVKFILFDQNYSKLSISGRKLYYDHQCPDYCYITENKNIKYFDAVVVNVVDLAYMGLEKKPDQRYVLYAMEPSDHTPIRRPDVDNFFDYTWSYKLSSDIFSPFFVVQDLNGTTVAPSSEPQWATGISKSSLNETLAAKFKSKNKAVAMIGKICLNSLSGTYATKLRVALRIYYQDLDALECRSHQTCDETIAKDYFFVLVTTDSESQDYVSDKVLEAYNNYAVPIINANADLSKFLPPGSYIDARLHTPNQIANIVNMCISNENIYRSFFKWTNFYTFRKRWELEGFCQLCSLLYREKRGPRTDLRAWWSK